MARRHKYEDPDRASDSSDADSESDDYTAPPKKKAKTSPRKPKGPSTKAEVTIRATDTSDDKTETQKRCSALLAPYFALLTILICAVEKIDGAVIGRIKKALALAGHEQTGEDEARAALRMASKLLERHNVTQADIMSQETESEQLKRAGTSIVSIRSTVGATTVNLERWTGTLASSMNTFFDCQSYNTRFNGSRPKVDWAFYGLAEQTVAAAHAFEMTYNLISAWSLKPDIGKGVHAKNCYRTGVAHGLYHMATKEKEQDKQRAVKKEQALLKARQDQEAAEDRSREDRLKGPEAKIAGPSSEVKIKSEDKPELDRRVKIEEVDDDEDFGGGHSTFDQSDWMPATEPTFMDFVNAAAVKADFNDSDNDEDLLDLDAEKPTLKRSQSVAPSMPPPASVIPLAEQKVKEETEDDSPWSSVGQLVAFRETSIAIGDDYLKTQGIKLRMGRKHKALEFKDSDARRIYKRGKQDAEKIDVRQKRLKDVEMDD